MLIVGGNLLYDLVALKFLGAIVYASFFEWVLHWYVMHKPMRIPILKLIIGWICDYARDAHQVRHHGDFGADHTFHLTPGVDKWKIPMAFWNGPALVAFTSAPFLLYSWYFGTTHEAPGIVALTMSGYYLLYEGFHWCMHLKETPFRILVRRSPIFCWLNAHHLLHHLYMGVILGVSVPLAVLCLGTLCPRAKKEFDAPIADAMRDVQPRRPILAKTLVRI